MLLLCVCAQKRAAYTTRIKSKRWYLSVLFWAIDIATINAFILSKMACGANVLHDQLAFRLDLVEELLLAGAGAPQPSVPQRTDFTYVRREKVLPPERLGHGGHMPIVSGRGRCVLCSYRGGATAGYTQVKCNVCERFLCLNSSRNCFLEWHTAPP